jgi:hypothetical protein
MRFLPLFSLKKNPHPCCRAETVSHLIFNWQQYSIPLEKLKVKIIYKKQLTALKTVRGSSSNKALSLYTTCSSSQSREKIPLSQIFFSF